MNLRACSFRSARDTKGRMSRGRARIFSSAAFPNAAPVGKVRSVINGKDENFLQCVERGSAKQRARSDFPKEKLCSGNALRFDGLGQGIHQQDRGIDIEHLPATPYGREGDTAEQSLRKKIEI